MQAFHLFRLEIRPEMEEDGRLWAVLTHAQFKVGGEG